MLGLRLPSPNTGAASRHRLSCCLALGPVKALAIRLRLATLRAMSRRHFDVTPDLMLRAYRAGLFPMAETRTSRRLYWLDPEQRGILPLDGFHLSRRLRRTVLAGDLRITCDRDFTGVIVGCATASAGREETWINRDIERLFTALYEQGHAHSVEAYQGDTLVGGLYGVVLGGAFFGESMFSRVRDASKVALVHLVARLLMGGFTLLDTQFVTAHLAQFGACEVSRETYRALLAESAAITARWISDPDPVSLDATIRALRPEAAAG
jgi:leucyl/phenylalanyl-tRNA--protein transferase